MAAVKAGPAGYTEWRLPSPLNRYLACIWTGGLRAPSPGPAEPVLPDGCMDIIWDGDRLFVTGPDTLPREAARAGGFAVGVRFRPGAAPLLLGVPANALRDQQAGLELFWADADQIAEKLDTCSDLRQAAGVLERAVAQRCVSIGAPDPVVEHASRLWAHAAPASPTRLAESAGLSERQLHRRFVAAVGYGPKALQRVLRFQAFLALCGAPSSGLAELAVLAGYSDQAHLSREARALAGRSPAQLRAARRHVRNVQDNDVAGELDPSLCKTRRSP